MDLYRYKDNVNTRWASFENPTAEKGRGNIENKGAKGHAFDSLKPGETKIFLDVQSCGVINRIWMTLSDRRPEMLRSLIINMYWDNAPTPAVSAPLGDFFCHILGRGVPFDNALFSDPNGSAFNCFIPMPFRTAAKITVTNDSDKYIRQFYYDINFTLTDRHDDDVLYFHAHWRRERMTTLGKDFEILPLIKGSGRFVGTHIGVITTPENIGWWGEGEINFYLDGDAEYPSLVGTGTEDYIGAALGMPVFKSRYQGCLTHDDERGLHSIYRYHIPDPVYFHTDCRVTMEQIGCLNRENVISLMERGVPTKVHSIFYVRGNDSKFIRLLDMDPVPDIKDIPKPEEWDSEYLFYYRIDDWSAVSFFYLDSPENGLPEIVGREKRIVGLEGNLKGE